MVYFDAVRFKMFNLICTRRFYTNKFWQDMVFNMHHACVSLALYWPLFAKSITFSLWVMCVGEELQSDKDDH